MSHNPENQQLGQQPINRAETVPHDADKRYDADKIQLQELNRKVDMLISELIDGNLKVGRVGHMKRTNDRLRDLEERVDGCYQSRLSPENVKIVTKLIDLFGSYKFLFGMLITTLFAAMGVIKAVVEIIKLLKAP